MPTGSFQRPYLRGREDAPSQVGAERSGGLRIDAAQRLGSVPMKGGVARSNPAVMPLGASADSLCRGSRRRIPSIDRADGRRPPESPTFSFTSFIRLFPKLQWAIQVTLAEPD